MCTSVPSHAHDVSMEIKIYPTRPCNSHYKLNTDKWGSKRKARVERSPSQSKASFHWLATYETSED